jgi:hypothetical protein
VIYDTITSRVVGRFGPARPVVDRVAAALARPR